MPFMPLEDTILLVTTTRMVLTTDLNMPMAVV